ncbi:MAG TPA: nickel-binding protein [Flavisolibacter sp.]
MPKYVIERLVPNVGLLNPDELKTVAQGFCQVIDGMGSKVQWINSFVTPDKIYCVYLADNREIVLAHVSQSQYPASFVSEVSTIIDPTTAA